MKRILFACMLLTLPGMVATAQNQAAELEKAAVQKKEYTKTHFSTAMIELDAGISRENAAATQKSMTGIMEMVHYFISKSHDEVQALKASGQSVEASTEKWDTQNRLYGEIKLLSIDPAKNEVMLKEKLTEFSNTI